MTKKVTISIQNVAAAILVFFSGASGLAEELIEMGRGGAFADEQITLWLRLALVIIGMIPLAIAVVMSAWRHWQMPTTPAADGSKRISLSLNLIGTVLAIVTAGVAEVIGAIFYMRAGVAFQKLSPSLWSAIAVFGVAMVILLIQLIVVLIKRWRQRHSK